MKNRALVFLFVFLFAPPHSEAANDQSKKTIFQGIIKGNVSTYFPSRYINSILAFTIAGTTGIGASIPDRIDSMTVKIMKQAEIGALNFCKDHSAALIDNVNVQTTPFGESANVLITVTGNWVCL